MQSLTSIQLKPAVSIVYPPFKNGLYIEEYFDRYWQSQIFPEKDRIIYLDVYWHNVFHQHGGPNNVMNSLQPIIENICKNAEEEGKVVFTVCQWDDLFMNGQKPINLHVFSVGNTYSIPLPLIVEDKHFTLQSVERIPYKEKSLLCSFVGSTTHHVRNQVISSLQGKPNIMICSRNSWNISVPQDHIHEFIEITKKSKFGLAPRGYGPSSFRFFEIMEMGVIPVYIHDGVNSLPYQEILDYNRFSVNIHINNINNLPDILETITEDKYNDMLQEMERVRIWFTMEGMCDYIRRYIMKKCNTKYPN